MLAFEFGVDGAVFYTVNGYTAFELVEGGLLDPAMGADFVAPQPAGFWKFNQACKGAVIGQEQKAFGIDIKPAYGYQTGELIRQGVKDGWPAIRVLVGGHLAFWFMIAKKPSLLVTRQGFAIDLDFVDRGDVEGGACDGFAVYINASVIYPDLGFAPRAKTGAGDGFGDAHGRGDGWRVFVYGLCWRSDFSYWCAIRTLGWHL